MGTRASLLPLKQTPLFSGLAESELAAVASVTITRRFPKNAIILNEGDQTDALYIINTGRVKVVRSHGFHKEVVIAILGPGDHFGEISLIDEQPRSASIVSKEACELTVVRKRDLRHLLSVSPNLAWNLMKALCARLREADQNIESLASMDVYGRVARLLLDMAEDRDGRQVIEERLTHQEIASMVGSSRAMVSRIFQDLIKGGYVAKSRGALIINAKLPARW